MQLTTEQRLFLLRKHDMKSFVQVQVKFRLVFPEHHLPSKATIQNVT